MSNRPTTTSHPAKNNTAGVVVVAPTTTMSAAASPSHQPKDHQHQPPLRTSDGGVASSAAEGMDGTIGDEITLDTLRVLMDTAKRSNPFSMKRPAPPGVKPRADIQQAKGHDVARGRSPQFKSSRLCSGSLETTAGIASSQQRQSEEHPLRSAVFRRNSTGSRGQPRGTTPGGSRVEHNSTPLSTFTNSQHQHQPAGGGSQFGGSQGQGHYAMSAGDMENLASVKAPQAKSLESKDRYDEGSLSHNTQADQEVLHKMMYKLRSKRQQSGVVTLFLDSVCFPANPQDWVSSSRLPQSCWITNTGPSITQIHHLAGGGAKRGGGMKGGAAIENGGGKDTVMIKGEGDHVQPQGFRRLVFPSEVNPGSRPQVAYLAASLDDLLCSIPNLHLLANPSNWGIDHDSSSPAQGDQDQPGDHDPELQDVAHGLQQNNKNNCSTAEDCLAAAMSAIDTLDIGFSEVIRQIATQCPERASLLDRLRAAVVDVSKNACDAVDHLQHETRNTKMALKGAQSDAADQIQELQTQLDLMSPEMLALKKKVLALEEELETSKAACDRAQFSLQLMQDEARRGSVVAEVGEAELALLRAADNLGPAGDAAAERGEGEGETLVLLAAGQSASGSSPQQSGTSPPQPVPPPGSSGASRAASGTVTPLTNSVSLPPHHHDGRGVASGSAPDRRRSSTVGFQHIDTSVLYDNIITYLRNLRSLSEAVQSVCVPIYGLEAGAVTTDPSANVGIAKGKWKKATLAIGEYEIRLEKWELLVKARESMLATLPRAGHDEMEDPDLEDSENSSNDPVVVDAAAAARMRASFSFDQLPPKPVLNIEAEMNLTPQDLANVLEDTSITLSEGITKLKKLSGSHLFLGLSKPPMLPPMSPEEACILCHRVEGDIAGGGGRHQRRRQGGSHLAASIDIASRSNSTINPTKEAQSGAPKFDFSKALAADPQTAIRNLAVEINRQSEVIGFKESENQRNRKEIASLQIQLQETSDNCRRFEAQAASSLVMGKDVKRGSRASTVGKMGSDMGSDIQIEIGLPSEEGTPEDDGDIGGGIDTTLGESASSPLVLAQTATHPMVLPNMDDPFVSVPSSGGATNEADGSSPGSDKVGGRKSGSIGASSIASSQPSVPRNRRAKSPPLKIDFIINCRCTTRGNHQDVSPSRGSTEEAALKSPLGKPPKPFVSSKLDTESEDSEGTVAKKQQLLLSRTASLSDFDGPGVDSGVIPDLQYQESQEMLSRRGSLVKLMPQIQQNRRDSFIPPALARGDAGALSGDEPEARSSQSAIDDLQMRLASNAKVWAMRADINKGLGTIESTLPKPTIVLHTGPSPLVAEASPPGSSGQPRSLHSTGRPAGSASLASGIVSQSAAPTVSLHDRGLVHLLKTISHIGKGKLHKDLLLEYEGKMLLPSLRSFVTDYFKTLYGTKKLVETHVSNLIAGLKHYLKKDLRIFTFAKFLTDVYSHHTLRSVSWCSRVLDETVMGPEYGGKLATIRQHGDADIRVDRSDEEELSGTPVCLLRLLNALGNALGRKPYVRTLAEELWAVSVIVDEKTMRRGMLAAGYGPSLARPQHGTKTCHSHGNEDWVDKTKGLPVKRLMPKEWTEAQRAAAWRTVDRAFFLAIVACHEESLRM